MIVPGTLVFASKDVKFKYRFMAPACFSLKEGYGNVDKELIDDKPMILIALGAQNRYVLVLHGGRLKCMLRSLIPTT